MCQKDVEEVSTLEFLAKKSLIYQSHIMRLA